MKTIKIKIPLAVDAEGNYYAWCSSEHTVENGLSEVANYVRDDIIRSLMVVDVEIPIPEADNYPSVQGKLEEIRVLDPIPVGSDQNLA